MKSPARSVIATLQLMVYAVLPKAERGQPVKLGEGVTECPPKEVRGGLDRFVDQGGELRVLIPDCLALAAPFVLFRLKRQGFSRCTVKATERGLLVEGRR